MIRPTARALGGLAGGLPLAALPVIAGQQWLWPVWFVFLGGCAVLVAIELALLPGAGAVDLTVEAPALVHIGDEERLVVSARSSRVMKVDVRLEGSGDMAPLPDVTLGLAPAQPTTASLPLRPHRRGRLRLLAGHVRWSGPLRLLWCEVHVPLAIDVQVVTNVRAVRQRALRMAAKREFQTGLKIERYVGDGSEFDSLREFVVGMDRRSIDWKATARHRQTLCREFRAERDHAVMLCVDTGRLMGEPLLGLPRLDHAIHAALQLGYLCLRTGDRVGLFAFADRAQQVLLPQAGVHALHAIQARMADLDYSSAESNFTLAMTELLQQLRRRTLVVLFTDFHDSVTAELMLRNVHWLARRHLLLFVAMRDPLLAALAQREPRSMEDVHRAVVAGEIERERLLVLERLRRAGAQVLDAEVSDLEPGLIARYLQVKRREML